MSSVSYQIKDKAQPSNTRRKDEMMTRNARTRTNLQILTSDGCPLENRDDSADFVDVLNLSYTGALLESDKQQRQLRCSMKEREYGLLRNGTQENNKKTSRGE